MGCSMANNVTLEKLLPYNLEVERLVLGWILATGKVEIELDRDDFYLDSHKRLWDVITDLSENGDGPDLISVVHALQSRSELESCGGAAYVASLSDGIPNFREGLSSQYSDIIREQRALRKGIQIANEMMIRCYDKDNFKDVVNAVFGYLDDELAKNERKAGPKPISELISSSFQAIEEISSNKTGDGMKTGYGDIDRMIPQGIQLKDDVIIAGRPSMGKSSLLMNLLRRMAENGNPTVVFSLEMPSHMLILRMIAEVARVPLVKMSTGFLNKDDWNRISNACGRLSQLEMWIDDDATVTVADIRSRTRRIRSKTPIRIIGVDYLQLVVPSKNYINRSDAEKISSVSQGLRTTAKIMNAALVAAAQLSREPEKRKDAKPKVSDLRQSGQIEQDADIIFLLHRPDLHEPNEENTGLSELILGKQRSGPTGTISMKFSGEFCAFDQADMEFENTHTPLWYDDK